MNGEWAIYRESFREHKPKRVKIGDKYQCSVIPSTLETALSVYPNTFKD